MRISPLKKQQHTHILCSAQKSLHCVTDKSLNHVRGPCHAKTHSHELHRAVHEHFSTQKSHRDDTSVLRPITLNTMWAQAREGAGDNRLGAQTSLKSSNKKTTYYKTYLHFNFCFRSQFISDTSVIFSLSKQTVVVYYAWIMDVVFPPNPENLCIPSTASHKCLHLKLLRRWRVWEEVWWSLASAVGTLSPQSLVRFTYFGLIRKRYSPAVQHFNNLRLHPLRDSFSHVLKCREREKDGLYI